MNTAQIANATPELTGEFYVLKPHYTSKRDRWTGKEEWSVEFHAAGFVTSMSHAKALGYSAPVLMDCEAYDAEQRELDIQESKRAMYEVARNKSMYY